MHSLFNVSTDLILAQVLVPVTSFLLLTTTVLLTVFQRSLIYVPQMPPGSRTVVATPDAYGMAFDEVELEIGGASSSSEGKEGVAQTESVKVRMYVIRQRGETSLGVPKVGETIEEAEAWSRGRPTILMLHANAGNLGHRLPIAHAFHKKLRCNVVMLSYRGYGHSTGKPTEAGILEDAQAALDWIEADRILGRGGEGGRCGVVVYGQSLGGAVAIGLVERNPHSVR